MTRPYGSTCSPFFPLVLAAAMVSCGGGGGDVGGAAGYFSTQRYALDELTVRTNEVYAVRPNENGQQITSDLRADMELGAPQLALLMDVVVPPNATAQSPQPALVWIHGGGLVAGNKDTLLDLAKGYARAGYVVALVDYRLTPALKGASDQYGHAVTQASEDVMNAVRFLKAHASSYGIDTARLATIGRSTGGLLSLVVAIEADTLAEAVSDFPDVSARVGGAIATGATLVNRRWDSDAFLHYGATDSPVLLMHASPVDGLTGATWVGSVLPTAARINGSGNHCTTVEQPNLSHSADLSFDGPQFQIINDFLSKTLSLAAVSKP